MNTPLIQNVGLREGAGTPAILDILNECLNLDIIMHHAYSEFADAEPNTDIAKFWREVVADEASHIEFWTRAVAFCKTSCINVCIDNPEATRTRLLAMGKSVQQLLGDLAFCGSSEQRLLSAYTIESYLFDPAFIEIFETFRFLNKDIDRLYLEHVKKFTAALERFHYDMIPSQIRIMGELMLNLYHLNYKLFREAITDPLTGLLNRRGFFNAAIPLLSLAQRNDMRVGVVIMDLDNFKLINERFGHPAGDLALSAVGQILLGTSRKADLSCRYGGDEFLILAQAKTEESLQHFCERLRRNIENGSKKLSGHRFTVSMGGTTGKATPLEHEFLLQMIARADADLGKAKAAGKNNCVLSPEANS